PSEAAPRTRTRRRRTPATSVTFSDGASETSEAPAAPVEAVEPVAAADDSAAPRRRRRRTTRSAEADLSGGSEAGVGTTADV
ncbi:hypothetical protein AB0C31_02650, partial [Actinoplanes philippinensis]